MIVIVLIAVLFCGLLVAAGYLAGSEREKEDRRVAKYDELFKDDQDSQ